MLQISDPRLLLILELLADLLHLLLQNLLLLARPPVVGNSMQETTTCPSMSKMIRFVDSQGQRFLPLCFAISLYERGCQ